MIALPAPTLVLFDATGAPFGQLRLVPVEGRPYAEGIFDVAPTSEAQAERSEVRWLCKRHFKRFSEHRLSIGDDGSLTVKKGSFRLDLHPNDDGTGFRTQPPAPPIRAAWATAG